MFENFQQAVRDAYLDLKNSKQLDFSREWPSTGDLKNWCIQCFEKGLSTEDEGVFVDYFREKDEKKQKKLLGKSLKEIVKDSETDKFRSLRNFIIGDTKRSPERDVVKFLAILIDFKDRPYKSNFEIAKVFEGEKTEIGKDNVRQSAGEHTNDRHNGNVIDSDADGKQKGDSKDTELTEGITTGDFKTENDQTVVSEKVDGGEKKSIQPEKRSFLKKNKYAFRFLGVASLIIAILFSVHYLTPEHCMCWNGENYVEVNCQKKGLRYQIIGLDPSKLETFRKIARPDTLGIKDLGNVWYSKIDNKFEFFTGSGYHPVQLNRSLKAATKYILETQAGRNAKETHQTLDEARDIGLQ